MLKNGDIQLNWSIKESFFLGVNIIYKSLHILNLFFWQCSPVLILNIYGLIFNTLLRHFLSACPALCLLFHPAIIYHSGARTNSLEDDCGAVCTVCVVSVRVCACLPQVSCDYFLYVKFILTVLWTSIAMWGFLKYLFWLPVYIYVRCVLVFLRNSMWDLSCFCVFVNLYGSVRFTLVFMWTSRNMWGSS